MNTRLTSWLLGSSPLLSLLLAEAARSAIFQLGLGCRRLADLLPGTCNGTALGALNVPLNPGLTLAGLPARIAWYGVAVTTIIAALGTMALALWLVSRATAAWTVANKVILYVALVSGTAFVCLNSYVEAGTFVVVKDILAPGTRLYTPSLAAYMLALAGVVRALTFSPLVPVAAAIGTVTIAATYAPGPVEVSSLARLLRLLLYASAAVLVLAALELHSFLTWIITTIPDPVGSVLTHATGAAVAASGAIYAGYLALLFLPATAVLAKRAQALVGEAQPLASPTERRAWLDSKGLLPNWRSVAVNVLAVLSPLLIGSPLAKLIDLAKGL